MKILMLILALCATVACGTGTDDGLNREGTLTSANGAKMTLPAAVAIIGRKCGGNADCGGLTCTDLVNGHEECHVQWVPFSLAPCPAGFIQLTTATASLGTVNLGNLHVTGYWCEPMCHSFSDCGNGLCCEGAESGSPGWCERFNPESRYLASLSCPAP